MRIAAEPGGAAAFASLLSGAYQPAAGETVVVVISGGNANVMKTDLYTKAVLTVIAVCLVWMCVNGATPCRWHGTARHGEGGSRSTDAGHPRQRGRRAHLLAAGPACEPRQRKGIPIYTQQGIRVNLGAQPLPVTVNNCPAAGVGEIASAGKRTGIRYWCTSCANRRR